MKKSTRFFVVLFLVLVLSMATYAYAAANSLTESGAGDGTQAISGYTVSNIHYVLDSTNPSNISAVTFSLAPTAGAGPATSVVAQVAPSTAWSTCTLTSGTWSCPLTGVTALAASNLRVVAAQ